VPNLLPLWEYLAIQATIIPLRPLRITVKSENEAIANVLQGKSLMEVLNYLRPKLF